MVLATISLYSFMYVHHFLVRFLCRCPFLSLSDQVLHEQHRGYCWCRTWARQLSAHPCAPLRSPLPRAAAPPPSPADAAPPTSARSSAAPLLPPPPGARRARPAPLLPAPRGAPPALLLPPPLGARRTWPAPPLFPRRGARPCPALPFTLADGGRCRPSGSGWSARFGRTTPTRI